MNNLFNESGNFNLSGATGDQPTPAYKFIVVPFGKFEVTVKLLPTNEFVGITEISINKDFLSDFQRLMD